MFLVADEEKYTVEDRKKYSDCFYRSMFSSARFSLAWFFRSYYFQSGPKVLIVLSVLIKI